MPTSTLAEFVADRNLEQQLALLADLSQDFASSLDIQDALAIAITRFMDRLDAEAASIFLLGDRDDELICYQCAGPVNITGLAIDANQGIVGNTVRTGECQMVRDVRDDPNFATSVDQGTGFVTRSILCVPLVIRNRAIGAIELINKHTGDGLFNDSDRNLVLTLAASAALAINNARMAAELVEKNRLEKELELAREIQNNLLPPDLGLDFPVAGVNVPAWTVSGDFYDYMPMSDGRIYFNLADVSGKGMNAALLMAKTSSLLRCLAKTAADAGDLLTRVNEELCETASHGMFVTVISGYYDVKGEEITLANAGHPPALCFSSSGELTEIPAGAPPLGIASGVIFPTKRFSLNGGNLYLFTDGVSESLTDRGTQLEVEGLTQLVRKVSTMPVRERLDCIVRSVVQDDARQHDDVTLLVVGKGR